MNLRIGNGYDVHRFEDEADVSASLTLGGVSIPCTHSLIAHSDGDVLLHALCDAILGALALGDIGQHFPDNDESYRDVSSLALLSSVKHKALNLGWSLVNADMTIVAQAPRISPHVENMRACVADCLQCSPEQISIKATTTEGLGFAGRGEGIACYAVVLLSKQ